MRSSATHGFLIAALILCAAGESPALSVEDVVFHASFDDPSKGMAADITRGGSPKGEASGKPELVDGRRGKALKLRNGADAVRYSLANDLPGRQGTAAFWLSAGNWDGSMSDVVQVLMHTDGGFDKQSGQMAFHQLSLQTLCPSPGLAALLWRYDNPAGTFPDSRGVIAPLKRADDAMSVLRSGEWYHYAVTWRDGVFTIYFNGQAMGSRKWDGVEVTSLGKSFWLGWDKEVGKLFSDPGAEVKTKELAGKPWESLIDEFTIFNRCLSARQIAEVCKQGAVEYAKTNDADDPAFMLDIEFLQSSHRLVAKIINSNKPDEQSRQGTLTLLDAKGGTVETRPFTFPAKAAEQVEQWPLPDLPEGNYTVRMDLRDGAHVISATRAFERVKPEWLGNTIGAEDVVLWPWTPIERKSDAAGVTAKIWGRTHRFEGPLPSSIESQGEPLLDGPARLMMDTGAGTNALAWSVPEVEIASPTKLRIASTAQAGAYTARGVSQLEYDGFIWSEFTFTAAQPATVNALTLEINLPKSLAKYFQTSCARNMNFPTPANPVPSYPFWGGFGGNNQYLYAMNNRAGLQWIAESDQHWYAKNPKQHFEVLPTERGGVIRIHFIRDPIEMPKQFTIAFGLMATPVRPLPPDWRGYGNSTPYRLGHPDKFMQMGFNYCIWNPDYGPGWVKGCGPKREWKPKAQKWGRNVQFTMGQAYAIRAAKDAATPDKWIPEWRQFEAEWWNKAGTHRNAKGEAWTEGAPCPSPSFIEHYVWDLNNTFRDYDLDGLYSDGVMGMYPCLNLNVGFGYIDREGKMRPTFAIRASREMMRRVYATLYKYRGKEGTLMMHTSTSRAMPVLSFSHATFDGEFMGWGDIRETMKKGGTLAGLSDDKLATVFNPHVSGLVSIIDGRNIYPYAPGPVGARQVMAAFLHHDIQDWACGYAASFTYPLDFWGIADPAVEYIGFWDNQPPTAMKAVGYRCRDKGFWEDTPLDEQCKGGKVSAYVNRAKGSVLLVCSDDSGYHRPEGVDEKEIKYEVRRRPKGLDKYEIQYEIKPDLGRLGLTQGGFKAFDAESLDSLEETGLKGDTLTLYLPPNGIRLITLRQREK